MNWIRAFRLHSFVQFICTISLAFVFANSALAIDKEECLTKDKAGTLKNASEDIQKECRVALDNGNANDASGRCENLRRTAENARTNYNKMCGDAGIGGSTCLSQMKKCAELGGDEEYLDSDDILLEFSKALGVPQSNIGSKCSGMSGQDFFDEKEKTDKKLEDVNDKLADVKKDLAAIDKDFNKDVQEVQEEIADAQKELKQKSLDISKEQRERAAEQAKTSAELTKTMRSQESLILQGLQKINGVYRKKNLSLIQFSDAAVKRACMKKVKELKKDYESIAGIGAEHFIERAMKKKKELQAEWDNCMLQFDQQRNDMIASTNEEIEKIQREINVAQTEVDEMKQQISSMGNQEEAAKKDDATALSNETTALSEKISRASSKLVSLQKTAEAEAKALKEKQEYLQKKATTASNALIQMEATDVELGPSRKKSKVSISEVQSAFMEYADAVHELPDDCPFKGKGEILSAAGISTKSESKKGTD